MPISHKKKSLPKDFEGTELTHDEVIIKNVSNNSTCMSSNVSTCISTCTKKKQNIYNQKISEFTKILIIERPDLLPRDRLKLSQQMYREWKK